MYQVREHFLISFFKTLLPLRVPLHRIQEAVCFLRERVESMPAEAFSAPLSDGFAVAHPESKPEAYNTVEHTQAACRASEQGVSEPLIGAAGVETEKKAKDVEETPFGASSSTLTKRTRAVGS